MEKHGIERRERVSASIEKRRREYAKYRIHEKGHPLWDAKVGGKTQKVRVHRLLAVAEYGFEAVEGMDVHHKNEIPWDNRIENLELMEHGEHSSHHSTGEDNPHSKLSKDEVKEIKRLLRDTGLSQREIAEGYDTTQTTVSEINLGNLWEHVDI